MKMTFVRRSACAVAVLVAGQTLVAERSARADAYQDRFEAERTALLARRATPEAVAPLAALVRMDAMLSPGRLAAVLREFVEGKDAAGVDPLVAAQASYFLSLEEDHAGQHEQADARRRGLGLLRDFWVLGPFDAQGRSGLERAYPPELALPNPRGSQCYPGKTHEVCWRRTSADVAPQGAVVLGGLLRPDNDAVAYLLAYVHSDQARWAALRPGSPGPFKAWLNGRPVMSRDVVRSAALDQDAAEIWLPRGNSVLLVKTVITAGNWQMFVRLTDPQGAALPGVTANAEAPAAGVAAFAPPAHPVIVHDLKEILRRRAEHAPAAEAASRWLDFARLLDLLRSEDNESKAAEQAAGRAARAETASPATRFAALELLGQVAREEDDARQAWGRALVLAPGPGERALLLAELGELAQRQHRPEAALQRWHEAVAADPTSVPVQLDLAGAERESGLYAAALLLLRRIGGICGTSGVPMRRLCETWPEPRAVGGMRTRRHYATVKRQVGGPTCIF
jgi:tetratricopeptide (TPR) repeat protein